MTQTKTLRLGTLGGAATFAGEATRSMRARYPEFGEPTYFPSMEACWAALKAGEVDVLTLGSERVPVNRITVGKSSSTTGT